MEETTVVHVQSEKKRKQSSTDDVTNSTPQKRNKTNPDRLTIYLRDENYINDKNTNKNTLAQIKRSFPNEKLLTQKIDCALTKFASYPKQRGF